MNTPRDHFASDRIGMVRAARLFSNVVSPPVMFAVLGLVFGLSEAGWWPGFGWAAVYGLIVSLLPILFVLYLLWTGRIAELHMTNTRERYLPYLTAVLAALLAYGILTWFDGPQLLRCLTIFNAFELAALGLINVWWLISLHTTGIMATLLLVGLVFGWGYSLIVLPFVIAVSWVRLYLRRHTPGQVVAGLGLGAITVFSLTLIGCFQ